MSTSTAFEHSTVADLVEFHAKLTHRFPALTDRSLRGIAYLIGGRVHTAGTDAYTVDGSAGQTYRVSLSVGSCECADVTRGKAPAWNGTPCCKHQLAALAYQAITQRAARRRARNRASRLSAYRNRPRARRAA